MFSSKECCSCKVCNICTRNLADVSELLLQHAEDCTRLAMEPDNDGVTALRVAARESHVGCTTLLLRSTDNLIPETQL